MGGLPYNNLPVGGGKRSEKRRQTEMCSFRMLPSTAKKWRALTGRSGQTPSAVANALVRDLVGERLEFRQDSAVRLILEEDRRSIEKQEKLERELDDWITPSGEGCHP